LRKARAWELGAAVAVIKVRRRTPLRAAVPALTDRSVTDQPLAGLSCTARWLMAQ